MPIRLPPRSSRRKPIVAEPAEASPTLVEVAAQADGPPEAPPPPVEGEGEAPPTAAEGAPLVERNSTGLRGFDACLGGGLVRRSVVLLVGRPGSGASALTMEAAIHLARGGAEVLYAASQEQGETLHARFAAISPELPPSLVLLSTPDGATAFAMAETSRAAALILDDLHGFTLATVPKVGGGERTVKGGPGTVTQVKALMDRARAAARAEDGPAVLVLAHADADNKALKSVEHEADARLRMTLHGEARTLRTIANRFGPIRQSAAFEVQQGRLVEVDGVDGPEALDDASAAPKRAPLPTEPATLAAAYEVVALRHESTAERDAVADAHRALTGTESPEEAVARALAAVDWAVREAGPAALIAIGQPERAATVAALAPVTDAETAAVARTTARDAARHAREVAERDGLSNDAFYVLRAAADAAKALATGAGPVEAVRHATEAAVHASRMGAASLPDLILALLRA